MTEWQIYWWLKLNAISNFFSIFGVICMVITIISTIAWAMDTNNIIIFII